MTREEMQEYVDSELRDARDELNLARYNRRQAERMVQSRIGRINALKRAAHVNGLEPS